MIFSKGKYIYKCQINQQIFAFYKIVDVNCGNHTIKSDIHKAKFERKLNAFTIQEKISSEELIVSKIKFPPISSYLQKGVDHIIPYYRFFK